MNYLIVKLKYFFVYIIKVHGLADNTAAQRKVQCYLD